MKTSIKEQVLRLALENDLAFDDALDLFYRLVMADDPQVIAWSELFDLADCESVSWRPGGEGVQHG